MQLSTQSYLQKRKQTLVSAELDLVMFLGDPAFSDCAFQLKGVNTPLHASRLLYMFSGAWAETQTKDPIPLVVTVVTLGFEVSVDKRKNNEEKARKFVEELDIVGLEERVQNTPISKDCRKYGCSTRKSAWLIGSGLITHWTNTGFTSGISATVILPSGVHVCGCGHSRGWGKRIRPPFYHTAHKQSELTGGTTILYHGDYVFTDRTDANIAAALRDCLEHAAGPNGKGEVGVVFQSDRCCSACATHYACERGIRYVVA
ncbi:hypothetical protein GGF32_004025 [Allomyces javanicus]|nr:hypothetical protein GGF32_004025 [Allomyces javanicus]